MSHNSLSISVGLLLIGNVTQIALCFEQEKNDFNITSQAAERLVFVSLLECGYDNDVLKRSYLILEEMGYHKESKVLQEIEGSRLNQIILKRKAWLDKANVKMKKQVQLDRKAYTKKKRRKKERDQEPENQEIQSAPDYDRPVALSSEIRIALPKEFHLHPKEVHNTVTFSSDDLDLERELLENKTEKMWIQLAKGSFNELVCQAIRSNLRSELKTKESVVMQEGKKNTNVYEHIIRRVVFLCAYRLPSKQVTDNALKIVSKDRGRDWIDEYRLSVVADLDTIRKEKMQFLDRVIEILEATVENKRVSISLPESVLVDGFETTYQARLFFFKKDLPTVRHKLRVLKSFEALPKRQRASYLKDSMSLATAERLLLEIQKLSHP